MGQVGPHFQNITSARAAARIIWDIIDEVRRIHHPQQSKRSSVHFVHSPPKSTVILKLVLKKMISSVTSTSKMYTSLIHHDLLSTFSMASRSMSNVDRLLHLSDHRDQENQLVFNSYNDSMMQTKDRSSSMDIKSLHTISSGYEIALVLSVKNPFSFKQPFVRTSCSEEIQPLMPKYMKQRRWPMHMISS